MVNRFAATWPKDKDAVPVAKALAERPPRKVRRLMPSTLRSQLEGGWQC